MGARCVKIIIHKLSNSWKMTDPKGNLQLHPHLEARVVAQIELTGGLRTSNRVTRVYAISGTARQIFFLKTSLRNSWESFRSAVEHNQMDRQNDKQTNICFSNPKTF